jgi:pSer/pThr/pTyr-binding forkhead associated (FHA) protein
MQSPPCPRCGRDNEAGSAYCRGCGQPLRLPTPPTERRCAGCGTKIQPSSRFCGQCGRPVADPAPATPRPAAGAVQPLRVVPVRHDGLPGTPHAVGPAGALCGRASGELRFADDATVSPEHARFSLRGEALFVEDLGSTNGTFVRLRAPRPLSAGDEIRLGRQVLRVEAIPRPVEGAGARPWGSADPGYRARLTQILEGGGTGEVFPLRRGENAIGREVGQVCFPADRYVSARHARIDVSEAGLLLSDVGSSNGTFVRIAGSAQVGAGDQVLVGMQLLRIE